MAVSIVPVEPFSDYTGIMKITAQSLLRSGPFIGVVAAFVAANAWSWARHKFWPVCCDQEMTIGFPIPFHISGGIAGAANFYLLGLLLDIAVALTVAITITWIVRIVRRWKVG